jgi:uncharacterized protein YkwD
MERVRASIVLLALAAAPAGAPVTAATAPATPRVPVTVAALPALDGRIVARIDAVRAAHGLSRLALAPGLVTAARLHSLQMARSGLFRHESPDGTAFWKRVRRFYGAAGYRRWSVGETIVWLSPSAGAADVVADWLASPAHRAILLAPDWREIGVAAVRDTGAPGFQGLAATVVTADFGVRTR